jgi:head-tail adaptor
MTARGARTNAVRIDAPGPPLPDGDGGFTEQWTTVVTSWPCAIENATAANQERMIAGTIETLATHKLTGDYLPQITALCRMYLLTDPEHPGRRFDVLSVVAVGGLRRELTIIAAEYISDADPRPQRTPLAAAKA